MSSEQDRAIRNMVNTPLLAVSDGDHGDLRKARELVKAIVGGVPEKHRANFIDLIAVLFNEQLGKTCSPERRRYCLLLAKTWITTLMENQGRLEPPQGSHREIFNELLCGLKDTRLEGRVKRRLGYA